MSVYSVKNKEKTGGSLDIRVPKDQAEGFVNNKRERYKFRFCKVFDQETTQEEIFENIALPVADSVLDGYNGTIFAYGQTDSGKTFTISGGPERYIDRGIIPRTLSYLFQRLDQESNMIYSTHISYMEIYNETAYDLLDSRNEESRLEDLPKVVITEDAEQNVQIRNLSCHQAATEEEALNLFFLGDTNRVIAETPVNHASTRSHCIFTIHLCRREPGSATLRRSKLHLVDLAGSDRASKTGLSGHLLTEAKYINVSLLYLEQVIIALSEMNRTHIPYRNSLLTFLLKDSLGGNCMTTMIATLSLDKGNIDESISTCRYAQRVAVIKNEAVLNEELDPVLLIARLKRENQLLKEQLAMVTEEQRDDKLTMEESQKLEELVKAFLYDPDPDVVLSLGPDMRKIQHCFSLLKMMILNEQGGKNRCQDGKQPVAASVREDKVQHTQHIEADLDKLKEMLKQRDDEISVLVRMLKNEKNRAQGASAQLVTSDLNPSSDSASNVSTTSPSREESTDIMAGDHTGRSVHHMKMVQPLTIGKKEAFEIFKRDHGDLRSIEENKILLKERSTVARTLGQQMQESGIRIGKLKKELEVRKRQLAALSVIKNQEEDDDGYDSVEEELRKSLKAEKKAYNNVVGNLRELKVEIQHLQLLQERAKAKFLEEFNKWWKQEVSKSQFEEESEFETTAMSQSQHQTSLEETLHPSSPGTPGFGAVKDSPAVNQHPDVNSSIPSLSKIRPFSSFQSFSIPLTGNQQADSDIIAFFKARQEVLNRAGVLRQ
ncbi:kinesin-like protein KIF6 isoform X2 [Gouania willdenowi]|uniref:kinesin-like protein KIF6 isoform X2 n=1 Tax=Gouania willdenowi TaxID=441366 RepID=UPI0010550BC7|nr:kinesin-like protein KIF6 isoform X2 [Gouania willdenowi]